MIRGMPVSHDRHDLLRRVNKLIAESPTPQEAIQRTTALLEEEVRHYSWIGIYAVKGDELVLTSYSGPSATEHTRIKLGVGICGLAALQEKTIIVPDVRKDSRYLMCFPSTQSEIVVPIKSGGKVVGEIDIDSDEIAAFGASDKETLEEIAERIAPLVKRIAEET